MTVVEMQAANRRRLHERRETPLPRQQPCAATLRLAALPDCAIEVKLARLGRDNGTYEDAAIKKILSPYSEYRSAAQQTRPPASRSFVQ